MFRVLCFELNPAMKTLEQWCATCGPQFLIFAKTIGTWHTNKHGHISVVTQSNVGTEWMNIHNFSVHFYYAFWHRFLWEFFHLETCGSPKSIVCSLLCFAHSCHPTVATSEPEQAKLNRFIGILPAWKRDGLGVVTVSTANEGTFQMPQLAVSFSVESRCHFAEHSVSAVCDLMNVIRLHCEFLLRNVQGKALIRH
jgi:hypothetical protein